MTSQIWCSILLTSKKEWATLMMITEVRERVDFLKDKNEKLEKKIDLLEEKISKERHEIGNKRFALHLTMASIFGAILVTLFERLVT